MPKDTVTVQQFDRRITIQASSIADDGQGGGQSWSPVYSCWADIQNFPHGRGLSLLFLAQQLYPEANTVIVIRYVPNLAISASMRVLSDEHGITHIYRILGPPVNLNRANRSIYLPCREDQAKGVN